MKTKRSLTLFFLGILVGLIAGFLLADGIVNVFEPTLKPVRYSWNSGQRCVVVYPDQTEAPCSSFSREELNEFHLEYRNPHR